MHSESDNSRRMDVGGVEGNHVGCAAVTWGLEEAGPEPLVSVFSQQHQALCLQEICS